MEKPPENNPNTLLNVDYQALLDENRALKDEMQKLRARLEEPEELQRAIREGDIDALVMPISKEDLMVFTLSSADSAYRTLMETANEDVVIVDAEFKITYASKRLLDKTGYSHGEVIGKPWMHFVDRQYKTFVEQRMEERRQGISNSYECKLISRDGSPYWAVVSVKPLFDNDTNFTGTLAMLTDINERMHAEESLREANQKLQVQSEDINVQNEELHAQSEELQMQNEELQSQSEELHGAYETLMESEGRFRSAFDDSAVGMALIDPDARFLRVNDALCRLLGFEKSEIEGHSVLNYTYPDDIRPSILAHKSVIDGEKASLRIEKRYIRKDGQVIICDVSSSPVYDAKGCLIYTVAHIQDITQRKQVEEKLEHSNQMINEILNSIQDDFYVLDRDWNFVYASKLFTSRIGKEPKDFVGKNIWKLFPKHIGTIYEENLRAVMDKGEIRRFDVGGKYTDAYYRMVVFPSAEGITVLGTDITEQKKAEKALQKSEEHYRLLFNTINEGFCIIEMLFDEHEKPIDYIYIEANQAFDNQTVLRNVVGKRMRELVPDHEEYWFEIYGKVALTGESVQFEHRAEALGRWYEVDAYRVGQPEDRRVAVIFSNITERKQLEEQTRLRAEELATVMETTPVAIWIGHDPQSLIITGNRLANESYDAESGENVSANVAPVRRFFHEGRELTADELPMQEAALKDIDVRNVELDVLLPSGKQLVILGSASPLHDANGHVRGSVGAFIDITERKQAENVLQESEARFKNLFKVISSGVAIYDVIDDGRDFLFKAMNPAGERIDHVRQEDIIGKSLSELFPDVGEMGLDAAFRRVWQTGKPGFLPVTLYEDNNIALWVTNYIYKLPSGELVAVFEDITELKQAEEERKKALETLWRSEDQLQTLIRNLKSGVALVDETGMFSVVNPSFMQIFGLDNDLEILNVNSQDWSRWEVYGEDGKLLHVDDHPVRKAAMIGKPVKNQLVALRNPGANEFSWLLVSAEPVFKEDGHIYRVICTYHDITERRQMEEALKKARDSLEEKVKGRTAELEMAYNLLKESEIGLAEAQRIAHLGNWDWNIITNKLYLSSEVSRIYGCEPQELSVNRNAFLSFIHPDDRDYVDNSFKEAL